MFDAIRRPNDMKPSRSPIHFTNELEVAASPDTIWSLLVDPEAWAAFYPGVERLSRGSRGAEARRRPSNPWPITRGSPRPRPTVLTSGPRRRCKGRSGSSWPSGLPTLSGARTRHCSRISPRSPADPDVHGGRRVIFVSGDDEAALAEAKTLMEQLGYAPVSLGKLAEGVVLAQARGDSWAPLAFQDLVKFDGK